MGYIQHKSEESVEDYLETILVLSKRLPVAAPIDIANELEYSKLQCQRCNEKFKRQGAILLSKVRGYIVLTEEGKKLASDTLLRKERHTLICQWLVDLGVSPETFPQTPAGLNMI